MANRLGNNPLFNSETETFNAEKERQELGINSKVAKAGRPRNKDLVRNNSAQEGLPEDWTRSTFIVRVEYLEKMKDYAYTERITIKEAMDQALEKFIADMDESKLLSHR